MASPASPEGYWRHPIETLLVNSQGTLNMLQLAERNQARAATVIQATARPAAAPATAVLAPGAGAGGSVAQALPGVGGSGRL